MAKRPNILKLATKISLESMTYTGITYNDPEYKILEPIIDDEMCAIMMHLRLEANRTVEDVAKRAKQSVEYTQEQLDKLADDMGVDTTGKDKAEVVAAVAEEPVEAPDISKMKLDELKEFAEDNGIDLTGCTNENILDLARYLDEIGKPVWIRHVLVPERSDYDEYLIRLDEFLHSLHNVQRVEVLPYHTLGVFKWETLGIPYKLEGINPPTKERVENANKLLHTAEYTGYLK